MTKAARFPGSAGPVVRSSFAALTAIVLAFACLFGFQQSAFSAVALDGIAQDRGAALLSAPLGVAADSLGNFYVVDPGRYHVIKFDASGIPKRIIGKQGFGNGQLYYPQGVAVGLHSNGDTLLYVADTGNSRVVVFDDEGHYVGKFGDVTPAGALLNPGGIAYLKNKSTPGGLVLVADTRNHRIMLFKDNGAFQKEYRCPSCPAGGIRPLGVSARFTRDGSLQIVASDELTGQVQVINSGGGWVRSIGRKGAGKGELRAPDDVAVDEDGNVWVADPAFGLEQISKFGLDGTFRYAFNTTGSIAFTQPHGVAIDEQGKIYVAESGGGAYRFREEAPKLTAQPYRGDPYWFNTKGVWFTLKYNGIEQTCRGGGSAVIRAPAGSTQTFTIDGGPLVIDNEEGVRLKMDMTAQQATRIGNVWKQGKQIRVSAKFTARCQDGKLLQKTLTFLK